MKNFKFTLFTPCYNGAHCFHRVFNSVLSQTYKNFEWIITNDCSTDNSDHVIRNLLKTITSEVDVKYIKNERNLGKHRSWNRALKIATGDLWICCDCDDSFSPNALKVFNERWNLICNDKSYCGMNCLCRNPQTGEVKGMHFPKDNYISNKLKLACIDKIYGEKWDCTRIDILRERPFPEIEGSYFTEVYIWWTLAVKGYKLLCINEPLRDYYYEPNSLCNNSNIDLRRVKQRHIFSKWYLTGECKGYLWKHMTKFQLRELGVFFFTWGYSLVCKLFNKKKL